jgi:hypothetical protein
MVIGELNNREDAEQPQPPAACKKNTKAVAGKELCVQHDKEEKSYMALLREWEGKHNKYEQYISFNLRF